MRIFGRLIFIILMMAPAGILTAQQQDVILRIEQKIGESAAVISEYSREELESLPQKEVDTGNEYVDGVRSFLGPLVRDVLVPRKLLENGRVMMTALNDYSIEIPIEDFYDYDVILALSMDGTDLTPRDKGPIWVIYPMTDHPEINMPKYSSRLLWQLSLIAAD